MERKEQVQRETENRVRKEKKGQSQAMEKGGAG